MSISEKIEQVNPDRITWCLAENQITLEDLASELTIALSTLAKALEGEAALSVIQLSKIAQYFSRGILFFLERESAVGENVHSAQFRTLTNQKSRLSRKVKALVERVENHRQIFVSLLEDLDERTDPEWRPSYIDFDRTDDIKRVAEMARAWLGLKATETFDSYRQAVESKGILIFLSNGYAGKWQIAKDDPVGGFSLYYPSYPVIVVKKQNSEGRQAFTLMHELGHLLLHQDSFVDEDQEFYSYEGKERMANSFAGNLLVPDSHLTEIDIKEFPHDSASAYDEFLREYCSKWSVSAEVILRRLLDEGHLKQKQYQAYRFWRSSLPAPEPATGGSRSRYQEPIRIFGEPFVNTVFDALHTNKITLTKASAYLDNLKISDLRQLESLNVHV